MADSAADRGPAGRDADPGSGHDTPDPRRWQALAVCLVAGFMTLLDVSIVNVALPSIKEGLHTPESDLQWVLSGYALAFGLFLIPAGRLGDARGRRAVFMAGLTLFTLSSAACGAAQSSLWLVIARLVQGLAGGMVSRRSPPSSSRCSRAGNAVAPSACSARWSASPPPSARCSAAC